MLTSAVRLNLAAADRVIGRRVGVGCIGRSALASAVRTAGKTRPAGKQASREQTAAGPRESRAEDGLRGGSSLAC